MNNTANASTTFIVAANAISTRADMQRGFSLSWMTQKVYDDLRRKFDACFKKTTEKVTKVETYFNTKEAQNLLKTLDKYRGRGLDERANQLLREDIVWLIGH